MLKCTFDPSNQYDDPAFRYPVQEALDELMRSDSPQLTADGSVPAVRRRIVQTGNFTHYLTVPNEHPSKRARLDTESGDATVLSKKPALRVDGFVALPYDALAEIAWHFSLSDLISLASTSHALRRLFLSRPGRDVWALVRRKSGYVLPDGMSEISFALLMAGSHCHNCGAAPDSETATLHHLRLRLCLACRETCLIRRIDIPQVVSPAVLQCARSTLQYAPSSTGEVYVTAEVVAAADHLRRIEADPGMPSSTEDFGKAMPAAVQRYVDGEAARIALEREQIDAAVVNQHRLCQMELALEMKRRSDLEHVLTTSHGWTQDQCREHWTLSFDLTLDPPLLPPDEDPVAWRRYHGEVQASLDGAARARRASQDRVLRKITLGIRFDSINRHIPRFKGIFPHREEFQELDAVKALWHPEDAQLDDSTWPAQEPIVMRALEDYAESTRMHAIRCILAANSGEPVSSLSTDPADYPASVYDDAFFNRISSLFLVETGTGFLGPIVYKAKPFPEALPYLVLPDGDNSEGVLARLAAFMTPCHAWAFKTVVAAAGLDVDEARPEALEALGRAFRWPACPNEHERGRKTWLDMVALLLWHGPEPKEREAGAVVELELCEDGGSASNGDGESVRRW